MSEKDELNTAKLDINLSGTDFNENKLDTFLQGAYDKTVAVSHNNNCTFHSMGRNVLEMYLEDEKKDIKNGLGERIIKKLLEKHGNKLENPVWADAGKHPFGSFAYRKSFWESVKYYFSNATWGWFNIINPFFWLSELIWGEYENDLYSVNKNTNNEIELHIDNNLSDGDKYRIGNILGQLIREEIADVMRKSKNKDTGNIDLQEKIINDFDDFVDLNKKIGNKENDEKKQLKVIGQSEPKTPYKNKMVQTLKDKYGLGKFNAPYVNQGSEEIMLEWQYLTSNDFLGEQEKDEPLETIVLETNAKPISYKNAKLFVNSCESRKPLDFNKNDSIRKQLYKYKNIDGNNLPLICVIRSGYFIGRCQPIVGSEKKRQFIKDLLNQIQPENTNQLNLLSCKKIEQENEISLENRDESNNEELGN